MANVCALKRAAYNKAYYARHRKRIRAEQAEYKQTKFAECPMTFRRNSMLRNARYRSRKMSLPFSLTIDDIPENTHCPALGIELNYTVGTAAGVRFDAPSLDRLVPELGYVPGNVEVISQRANTIKIDASAEEILAVGNWVKKNVGNNQK